MGDPYHDMLKQLRMIQSAVPLERARMATDFLEKVDSLARQATAIRDVALKELVDGGDLSYAKAADRVNLSKSMVAKVHRTGRSGEEVKRLAVHIPTKPIEQSIWKDEVCLWYAHGESLNVAMERAPLTRGGTTRNSSLGTIPNSLRSNPSTPPTAHSATAETASRLTTRLRPS